MESLHLFGPARVLRGRHAESRRLTSAVPAMPQASAAERAAKQAAEMAVLALEEQRSQQTELARQQLAMEREKLALERQALEAALATQKAEAEMLESQKVRCLHAQLPPLDGQYGVVRRLCAPCLISCVLARHRMS